MLRASVGWSTIQWPYFNNEAWDRYRAFGDDKFNKIISICVGIEYKKLLCRFFLSVGSNLQKSLENLLENSVWVILHSTSWIWKDEFESAIWIKLWSLPMTHISSIEIDVQWKMPSFLFFFDNFSFKRPSLLLFRFGRRSGQPNRSSSTISAKARRRGSVTSHDSLAEVHLWFVNFIIIPSE